MGKLWRPLFHIAETLEEEQDATLHTNETSKFRKPVRNAFNMGNNERAKNKTFPRNCRQNCQDQHRNAETNIIRS